MDTKGADPLNEPVPGPDGLTRSVRLAIEYLAKLVQVDCGTKNGRTALYWHLIHTVSGHAGKRPAPAPPPEPVEKPAAASTYAVTDGPGVRPAEPSHPSTAGERLGERAAKGIREAIDALRTAHCGLYNHASVLQRVKGTADALTALLNDGTPDSPPRAKVKVKVSAWGARGEPLGRLAVTFAVDEEKGRPLQLAQDAAERASDALQAHPAFRAGDWRGDWPEPR